MLNGDVSEKVIVALDCDADRARELSGMLKGHARWVKVGMTLFYREGPAIVDTFKRDGYKVFLDLKLHDIPHQVKGATESLSTLGIDMMTIHASGGMEMMRAAVDAAGGFSHHPILLAVTVLTSTDDAMLAGLGITRSMHEQVIELAEMARGSGCDGVVSSPLEAMMLKGRLGKDAAIVCPGIRPKGSATDDQSRIATPSTALAAGATHLVIGRPITQADDPVLAFDQIVSEMGGLS